MNRNRTLIIIGLILAISIPTVIAVASNAITVTIHPSQSITLTSNATSVYSGDTIRFTATLSAGSIDRTIYLKSLGVAEQSKLSVGGVAVFDVVAVNAGATDITKTWNVDDQP